MRFWYYAQNIRNLQGMIYPFAVYLKMGRDSVLKFALDEAGKFCSDVVTENNLTDEGK